MKIKISNLSTMPIYQQIASEIRNKILSNELMSNMQLPSIRALSKELEVGIITIKKAYEVLLQENLIYSKGAVGYFVNEINREEILLIKKEEYLKEIEKVLIRHNITFFEFNKITELLSIAYEHRAYLKNEGGTNPPEKH